MAAHIRDMDNPPTTAAQLPVAVLQVLINLRSAGPRTLVWSVPLRVRAVLAARGGHTHCMIMHQHWHVIYQPYAQRTYQIVIALPSTVLTDLQCS